MEMICWGAITKEADYAAHADALLPYVRGKYPLTGGFAWSDVAKVYGVGHVLGNHWVCYEVSLDEHKITVYDSRSEVNDWEKVSLPLKNAAKFVAWLCDVEEIWVKKNSQPTAEEWSVEIWVKKNSQPTAEEWSVVQGSNTPQQLNTSDCGIMASMFLESLLVGKNVTDVDPRNCRLYRRLLCSHLYRLSCEAMIKNIFN